MVTTTHSIHVQELHHEQAAAEGEHCQVLDALVWLTVNLSW